MLYLAEVQKQKGSLLGGGGKTELKLLACQQSDQNWNNVPEEAIAAEEASKLNDGALVLVELSPSRQIQRIQEAGRPLVNILQNLSRQLKNFKQKEDEIEQWKQSLMFQVQELNRREMDLDARMEHLQEQEEKFQTLEAEKQGIETLQEEVEKLQSDLERRNQELEGAWEQLRGEQRRLDEFKAEAKSGATLDEEQSRAIGELLNRLSGDGASTETVRENLNQCGEFLEQQQAILNQYWEQLENLRNAAQTQQEEVEQLEQSLRDRQNEFQQAQANLEQQKILLQTNTTLLNSKQDFYRLFKEKFRQDEELQTQLQSLAVNSGDTGTGHQVNMAVLQKMSVEELQNKVKELQDNLKTNSSFVQDQEQELKYKQDTIDELARKIQQATGEELKQLEAELAEEQDFYQMQKQTLVGQRRSLLESQSILKQHQNILLGRVSNIDPSTFSSGDNIDLKPLLSQIITQNQQKSQDLQKLETEIEQIRSSVEQDQTNIEQSSQELETKKQELKSIEEQLISLRASAIEAKTKLNLSQDTIQPIQDALDGLRQKIQGMTDSCNQIQETSANQQQAVDQMRQTLQKSWV
ncbi:MAG TPA: pilus motility taxis protein HmpF [Nostocaceae cyanobacterium]|nr:pilus motility taxis protein HmpF [Nostocaceae cyanobacterium]